MLGSGINASYIEGTIPTYEDMAIDIEKIVSMKASKYKIPNYTREDIAQEIRLVAVRALKKFDPTKSHAKPFHFVARCVDNYLINLRRDNDAFMSRKKLENADISTHNRLAEKHKIYYPVSLNDEESVNFLKGHSENTYSPITFHDSVLMLLPSGLHNSYHLLIEQGQDAIPKHHFTQIKKIVIELYG